MPRFYFHLHTPAGLEQDEVGLDLDSVEAAYLEACHAVRTFTADLLRSRANPRRYAFAIMGATGPVLMEVPFSEVLDGGCKPLPPTFRARRRRAEAEMSRTVCLIAALDEKRTALRATLAETKRLLAQAGQVSGVNRAWMPPSQREPTGSGPQESRG